MARIAVLGGTGNMGGRIVADLVERGAEVRALVRPGTPGKKIETLTRPGVEVIAVDLQDSAAVVSALGGAACVVSAVQGLRDVIVDAQTSLLEAAASAGVPRFIPSDFASDIFRVKRGENRNFDLRLDFHERLDKAAIAGTSILNGAFAEILTYGVPLLDLKAHRVGYWEDESWAIDFTAMRDVAAFTAAAALDASSPKVLRIAGFQVTPKALAAAASEITGTPFALVRLGGIADLAAYNQRERAAHPEGENEVFPRWQQSQYMHSMFTTQLAPLDNERYPGIVWTGLEAILRQASARA